MVISDLPDKQFKIIVIKMLSELRTMHKLRKNFNKETENISKYWTEITNLKNIITELKSSMERFNISLNRKKKKKRLANSNTGKWNLSNQKWKKKKTKTSEESLRDLGDRIKWVNICIIRVPEREERKQPKGYSKK